MIFTVQNEFEFPGDQMVGLPTLVHNPPTANNIGNLTGLDRQFLLFGLALTNRIRSVWQLSNPINKSQLSKPVRLPTVQVVRVADLKKKEKKEKKRFTSLGVQPHRPWFNSSTHIGRQPL
jgi:hypothetical protein